MTHAQEVSTSAGDGSRPRSITLQCAWCLEWIRGSMRDHALPTIRVSHGLCSRCMERLTRSEAMA